MHSAQTNNDRLFKALQNQCQYITHQQRSPSRVARQSRELMATTKNKNATDQLPKNHRCQPVLSICNSFRVSCFCVLFFTKILHTTIRNQFTPSPITLKYRSDGARAILTAIQVKWFRGEHLGSIWDICPLFLVPPSICLTIFGSAPLNWGAPPPENRTRSKF